MATPEGASIRMNHETGETSNVVPVPAVTVVVPSHPPAPPGVRLGIEYLTRGVLNPELGCSYRDLPCSLMQISTYTRRIIQRCADWVAKNGESFEATMRVNNAVRCRFLL